MNTDLCLICIILIPLAATGLALIHQGLGRSRSAAHAMLATPLLASYRAIVFVLIGSSWMGFSGGLAHTIHLAGKPIDWLGAEPFFGWIGLDTSASILFYNASSAQIILTIINATLAASAGCLAAVLTTQLRYRKPDASLSANGWIAGLVAGSAGAGLLSPLATIFIALVAGTLVTLLVETLELRLFIDDPGGAISVHLGAGLWGVLAYGLFAPRPRVQRFSSRSSSESLPWSV